MMESIDVLISFDTTGSMYPCLTQVRNKVSDLVRRLMRDIPNLRVGVIAHGDYCDGDQAITKFDFSSDERAICRFVDTVRSTGGGDAPECYELVLHEARTFSWSAGKNKALVLIGDDVPHPANDYQNKRKLDWKNEARLLVEAGVHVHAVQALGKSHATPFYSGLAEITGGCHLELHQFAHVSDLLMAICYRQAGPAQFSKFESEVAEAGRMNRSLSASFETLSGRRTTRTSHADTAARSKYGAVSLDAVHPSRFQALDVDEDCAINEFVRSNGLAFKTGRGFYQFTKPVDVQDYKEVVLVDRASGDMYTGKAARKLLKLPVTGTVRIKPDKSGLVDGKYIAMIQSTSANRKLLGGTKFLYEVSDYSS